jgi:hypothetical protein
MANKNPKLYQVGLQTTDKELHGRYKAVSKRLKDRGISNKKIYLQYLVDSLEKEEANNLEGLKQYI